MTKSSRTYLCFSLIACLLAYSPACAQTKRIDTIDTQNKAPTPVAEDTIDTQNKPIPHVAEDTIDAQNQSTPSITDEQLATQHFIDTINEARKELTLKHIELAHQKIILARNLLTIVAKTTPEQRRLTRVEFGGSFYVDDLGQRKSYTSLETLTLDDLTLSDNPRWVKSTRQESDAQIIYVTLDISNNKALNYLDRAENYIATGNSKDAEVQLDQLINEVIKVDNSISTAAQARDYITLTESYIHVSNFFGARHALGKAIELLDTMKNEDKYKIHRADIILLYKNANDLQTAFAKQDVDQVKDAEVKLKAWHQQLSDWASE